MADTKVPSPAAATPLLEWLFNALKPMSRSKIKDLLRHGQVLVNGAPTTQFDRLVQPADRITISQQRPTVRIDSLRQSGITIVFEDDDIIVIDKPPGLLTVSTDDEKTHTAFVHLKTDLEARRAGRPYVVHRLDRETSGLLMFTRTEAARDALKASWPFVEKTYLAIVEGIPRPPEGTVENFLEERRDLRVRTCTPDRPNAKRAVSHYRLVKTVGKYSLIEVKLKTGRKHQIRVHLAGLECPVIGDEDYHAKTDPARRLGLHAWRLCFPHPISGKRIEIELPLPEALRRILDA